MSLIQPVLLNRKNRSQAAIVRSAAFLAAAAAGVAIGSDAYAGSGPSDRPYLFSNASSDTFFTFAPPSLNNGATAAFVTGFHPSDARLRIAGTNGAATTVLDTTGAFDTFGESPAINDAGQIAVEAGLSGTSDFAMIRTSVGGPTVTIARTQIQGPSSAFEFFRGNPTINAQGQVAFVGLRHDSVEGVFVGDGSAAPVPLASNLDGLFDFSDEAHINNSGIAAFRASDSNSVTGIFTAGAGGIGTVALAGPGMFNFSEPSINNAGTVAFVAYGSTDRIYTGSPGGPLTVIASSGGSGNSFWNFDEPLINDNGDVVFFAELFNFNTGLFDGPDPVRDRIIMTGDSLFGSTLEELYFTYSPMFKSLNNGGQVAFRYDLSDGRSGVAIATPVPFGDANADGMVNLSDFNVLAANFGQTDRNWSTGDFNGDTLVNLSDFNLLAANFGLSALGPEVTAEDWSALASVVPEPGSLSVLGGAVTLLAARRCRKA